MTLRLRQAIYALSLVFSGAVVSLGAASAQAPTAAPALGNAAL
jgi:hypothetical protein